MRSCSVSKLIRKNDQMHFNFWKWLKMSGWTPCKGYLSIKSRLSNFLLVAYLFMLSSAENKVKSVPVQRPLPTKLRFKLGSYCNSLLFSSRKIHDIGGEVYFASIERISDNEFVVCPTYEEGDGTGTAVRIYLVHCCHLVQQPISKNFN